MSCIYALYVFSSILPTRGPVAFSALRSYKAFPKHPSLCTRENLSLLVQFWILPGDSDCFPFLTFQAWKKQNNQFILWFAQFRSAVDYHFLGWHSSVPNKKPWPIFRFLRRVFFKRASNLLFSVRGKPFAYQLKPYISASITPSRTKKDLSISSLPVTGVRFVLFCTLFCSNRHVICFLAVPVKRNVDEFCETGTNLKLQNTKTLQ